LLDPLTIGTIMKISERTFVVSGGSSGLGKATVEMLLDEGAFVCILDLNDSQQCWKKPGNVKFFKSDITQVSEIEQAIKETMEWIALTGAPLGGVINCAGIGSAAKINNPTHSLDLWNFVIAVNLTGTFNLTRLVNEHLLKVEPEGPDGERGIIILTSSSAAYEGQTGQTVYSATKGAIRSMTLPMARDLGRYGIRVNTIAPSVFESPMTARMPSKVLNSLSREMVFPNRFGQSIEFAKTVKWMIETPFVNGESYRLSGASRMPARM